MANIDLGGPLITSLEQAGALAGDSKFVFRDSGTGRFSSQCFLSSRICVVCAADPRILCLALRIWRCCGLGVFSVEVPTGLMETTFENLRLTAAVEFGRGSASPCCPCRAL